MEWKWCIEWNGSGALNGMEWCGEWNGSGALNGMEVVH